MRTGRSGSSDCALVADDPLSESFLCSVGRSGSDGAAEGVFVLVESAEDWPGLGWLVPLPLEGFRCSVGRSGSLGCAGLLDPDPEPVDAEGASSA